MAVDSERQLQQAHDELERLKRLNNEYRLAWNAAEDQVAAMRAAIDAAQDLALHSIEVGAPGLKVVIREIIARNIAQRLRIRAGIKD